MTIYRPTSFGLYVTLYVPSLLSTIFDGTNEPSGLLILLKWKNKSKKKRKVPISNFTLIKTSGCSKPASRASILKYVSSDAGIPLRIPGPSTITLCGSKCGRTWTLKGLNCKKKENTVQC